MINKRKILKIIDIIFWSIIFIGAIFDIFNSINNGNISINMDKGNIESLGIKEYVYIIFSFLFLLILFIVKSLLTRFYFTIIYLGTRTAYKKYSKEKLDKVDFKNDKYYRDIVTKYSPAVLSYIDDFKIDEKDIVATLMSLELKKKINIKDKIQIINNIEDNLDENEKYVFNKIQNNTFRNISILEFENKVINDCLKYKLLQDKKDINKKIIIKICLNICIYLLLIISFNILPILVSNIHNANAWILLFVLLEFILFLAMIIFPFKTIIYIKTYFIMNKLNPYVRNDEAKEINIKLEGLKKYIKDYSLLKEKEYEEIVLWKEYLIYSVIFGQNPEIVSKTLKKIYNNY